MLTVQNDAHLDPKRAEEERIRFAYARRKEGSLYSLFSPGHLFIIQECERRILALLKRYGHDCLEGRTILDIGCGKGFWILELIQWGARPENLAGIDLLPEQIAEARQLFPAVVKLLCGNAAKLDFSDGVFDLVIQATAFTSILDMNMKLAVASEMLRVLKKGGLILWYDYSVNNPLNPDVRGVSRKEISQLFPGCQIDLERITLAPPVLRFLARYSRLACTILSGLPFLCTHYVGVIQKKGDA